MKVICIGSIAQAQERFIDIITGLLIQICDVGNWSVSVLRGQHAEFIPALTLLTLRNLANSLMPS